MKILKVSLKNFSRIYSGLGKSYIDIDLRKLNNKIFLFVGENGSGKTSIMRTFHPFAYNNGTGDNTANADFIIEGKDGEKKISIEHNGKVYDITHIYSRKKDGSISVKSFIMENGVELNDSGTVKTFKDVVQDKLGLDEAFLGLLSLGNTIDGFVKYTSANRKKFAIQIFSQLSIYNKYYKIASSKVRDTKSILANVTAKLEKYKMFDVEELKCHEISLQADIVKHRNELNDIMLNIGSSQRIIMDNEELIRSYDDTRRLFDELLRDIDTMKGKVKTQKDLITLQNDLRGIESNMNDLKITISGIESSLSSELDIKDTKLNTIKTLSENVERMSKNIDLQELTELEASLNRRLTEINSIIGNRNRPVWSKEDLIKINIYLDELRGMCIDLINETYNLDALPSILNDYLKDNHVVEAIDSSCQEMRLSYDRLKSLTLTKSILDNIKIRSISQSKKCEENCPYVEFYSSIISTINGSLEDNSHKLQSEKEKLMETEDMLKIANTIKRLYNFIDSNDKYFQLPNELFDKNTFILQYIDDRTIYNTKYLSDTISLEESFEEKNALENKLAETKKKIESLSESTAMYDEMNEQIKQLTMSIADIDKIMDKQRKDLEYNTNKLNELCSVSEEVVKQIEVLTELQNLRNSFNETKSKLSVMESGMKDIQETRDKCAEYERSKTMVESKIRELEENLKNTQFTISSINELHKEQRDLMTKYSMDKLILESVSPTTGIPLDFINYYIKEEMIGKVNELLDMVYHGKLKLLKSKTVIDEDEFTIPYMKRSTIVSDISKASDGEKAIISLAFSLVLLKMTSGPYNILLLDEMDTTLDTASRAKYIELLEQFMTTINAEQLFLISHNSMFDVYPVNVLMTSHSTINMSNANILDLTI